MKKGIHKKLLIGPAQTFNSQSLNLFGFSISVSSYSSFSEAYVFFKRVKSVEK